MDTSHQALIEQLQANRQAISAQDTMAEAGRKALVGDFIKMLQNEDGCRLGEDSNAVHDMRVGTRRMRSTLRLLSAYYKPKAIQPHIDSMRSVAEALGGVRDLDVMMDEIRKFGEAAGENDSENGGMQPILERLEKQRGKAQKALTKALDKREYREFVKDFTAFLNKPGKGAMPVDADELQPFQVRHLLPELIYEHLGAVRAYDDIIETADEPTLHQLRIEFKRLRYAVAIFSEVLGSGIGEFIEELKVMQDHLGRLNDLHVAQEQMNEIARKLDPEQENTLATALAEYIEHLGEEHASLRANVGEKWQHFNTKKVQRLLANAVAGL
jgi:CHAD domain-containing protein